MTTTAKRFKVLGVNDDKDFCECCGKTGLKRVVWIEDSETGKLQHFGVVCAANPAKAFNLQAEIKSAIADYQTAQQNYWRLAHAIYRKAGGNYVSNGIPLYEKGGGVVPADAEKFNACKVEAKKQAAQPSTLKA